MFSFYENRFDKNSSLVFLILLTYLLTLDVLNPATRDKLHEKLHRVTGPNSLTGGISKQLKQL